MPENSTNKPIYVYCIAMHSRAWVKFGQSTDVQSRMAGLQGACPERLHLIHRWHPDYTCSERQIHMRFSEYRGLGEWFRNEGAVAEFVEFLSSGPNVRTIQGWFETRKNSAGQSALQELQSLSEYQDLIRDLSARNRTLCGIVDRLVTSFKNIRANVRDLDDALTDARVFEEIHHSCLAAESLINTGMDSIARRAIEWVNDEDDEQLREALHA